MAGLIRFQRLSIAKQLADALMGRSLFTDAHNGLFLAAPRRTGKTTFLRHDLKPELEARGVVVVYVDLWADPRRDPGDLIAGAIGQALQPHLGLVTRTARKAGLEMVTLGGSLSIDVRQIGRLDGATLVEALQALTDAAQAPVALIIDEAQHSLTSEAGDATMAALKSARDQLNSPDEVRLMLVMSGSDRDKLLRLVNTNGAPFYGSDIRPMPELDTDFVAHVAHLIEGQRADLRPVDQAMLFEAFQRFGCRPQWFMERLGQVLSPLSGASGRFERALIEAAHERQREEEDQMASDYLGLKPLEQAVLWRMLEQGRRFRPYDAEARAFYQSKTGRKVSTQQAQNALEALREHTPTLVWKSSRREYAVDDAAMGRWYEKCVAVGAWPPAGHIKREG